MYGYYMVNYLTWIMMVNETVNETVDETVNETVSETVNYMYQPV